MLETVQIITLFQGLFLIIALSINRHHYLKPTFNLLLGTIISVILYVFGDNKTALISHTADIFLFDKSLFITFFFLFIKYNTSKAKTFLVRDYLFFIPNILFFVIELLEIIYSEGIFIIDFIEILVELTFLCYMIAALVSLTKTKSQKWMLYFIVPLVLLIGFSILEEVLYWFHFDDTFFSLPSEHFGEYTIVIIAFLFYTIALKLMVSPKDILIENNDKKYKYSSLHSEDFESIKLKILQLMDNEKMFKDPKLSVQKVSETLNIPRQYISEVLNKHMNTNFQDLVNSYRVNAFVNALNDEKNEHFSLMGIAENVGFNSKTSFYNSFKKFKKMTPAEYKTSIVSINNKSTE